MAPVFGGIRVVDFTQGMAGPMAAMVLADNGADVIKVEPPAGDWARSLPGFLMWNRGKKSVVVDVHDTGAVDAALALVAGADAVLTAFHPGSTAASAFAHEALMRINPTLVHCQISGFGLAQHFEHLRAYEAIVAAKSGRMRGNELMGGTRNPDARNRPIFTAAPTGSYGAALLAVEGTAAALFARTRTGRGQRVETSLLDGLCAATMRLRFGRDGDTVLADRKAPGRELMLRGIAVAFLTPECKDGRYIQMCARQDEHFHNWMAALDLSDVMEEDRFARAPMGFGSETDVDELEAMIRERMRQRTQAEWMDLFIDEFDVGADPFLTPDEFLAHPQMLINDRIVELDDPVAGAVRQVGPLVLFSETPGSISASAPRLGEHQPMLDALRASAPPPARPHRTPRPHAAADPAKAPFDGVTIVEVASFLAGPLGTTLAAELGARVIKVEPVTGDLYRRVGLEAVHVVAGKESIAVDLKSPAGREILYRLVSGADALMHNFRPGAPERLGMDYDTLRSIKPDLVYLYAGSYGSRGPQSHRPAFHSTPNALTGGGILQAGRGNVPVDDSYPDPCAGIAVGAALAMGLLARQRYGTGQRLETSMLASNGYVHSNDLVRYRGAPPQRIPDGGQHGPSALYRLYQCADGWILLAAVQPVEWLRLTTAVDRDEWRDDARFSTPDARRDHDEALTTACEALFAGAPAAEWEKRLAAAGVPVAHVPECTFEQLLAEQGLLRPETHLVHGEYWRLQPKVRFSESATRLAPGCAVGQHTDAILEELGYTAAQRQALGDDGVVLQFSGQPAAMHGAER